MKKDLVEVQAPVMTAKMMRMKVNSTQMLHSFALST